MYHPTSYRCQPMDLQRDSSSLFTAIVQQTRDGIATTDMDGQITFANKAFAYLFGCDVHQLLDQPIEQLFASEQSKLLAAGLDQVCATGQFEGMFEHIRDDESHFTALLAASLLRSPADEPMGMIITVRDATAMRAAEAAERRSHSLQDAVESMERVIGVLGHELRTPLAAIRVSSELLQSSFCASCNEAETVFELVNTMHDQSLRMSDMIHNMLEAARLNSGHAQWHWTDVAIANLCEETLQAIQVAHKLDRIKLTCDVQPRNLTMRGDRDAIERLLTNLVTNAIHHTREGAIHVTFAAASKGGRPFVVIGVQDCGEGIPPEVMKQLGKPFALNCGMLGADRVHGSGLGLAICRGIIAAHGGTIAVSSQLDKGTHFTVHLRADLEKPNRIDGNIICEPIAEITP